MDEFNGWIKLSTKILKWEWWDDPVTAHLFVYILLKANWKDGNWHGVPVPRGSFISSLDKMAAETGLTNKQVRTALDKLVSTGEVGKKKASRYTHIFVENYDLYQGEGQEKGTKRARKGQQKGNVRATLGQSEGNERATIEDIKDNTDLNKTLQTDKTDKTERHIGEFFPNDEILDKAFGDYVANRKALKKPLTDRAIDLAIKKLQDLSGGDNDKAVEIINQSIINGWAGLFELKGDKKQGGSIDWSKV